MDVAFEHWSASWPVLIAYVTLAAAHLAGLRRTLAAPASATRRELVREAVLCQLGLAVIAAALLSPMGYLSDVYIWVRALQLLLIAVVGPALIVLGAPWAAFRLAPRRLNWLLARPVLAVVAANVVWLAWQLPGLYDAAHGSAIVALVEHVSYVVAGLAVLVPDHLVPAARAADVADPPVRAGGRHGSRVYRDRHGAGVRLGRLLSRSTPIPRITSRRCSTTSSSPALSSGWASCCR